MLAELSCGLGEAMVGINPEEIKIIMEERGI
jgi:pyridoxal 5'-phosphate synthase pdxS subunit